MAYIFKLPDVGEGMAEGEIASWLVEVGDVVKEGDPILELQNDKLLQEIPSPVDGTVTKIIVEPGTVSMVGDPLIEFDGDGTTEAAGSAEAVVEEAPTPAPVETPAPVAAPTPVETPTTSAVEPTIAADGRVLAMPSVRRFAYENGLAIETVPGTGKHGHITLDDVKAVLSGGAVVSTSAETETVVAPTITAPALTVDPSANVTREALTPMRKAISNAMTVSKTTAPHVTLFDEIDVTKLVEHRKLYKEMAAEQDIKLTYLPYIVKALVTIAKKYPIFNSSLDNEAQEIVYKNYYNIGIATDTERGLMVPNIKNADSKGILAIADEISLLAQSAHDGSIGAADMSDGTLTITNIGSVGGGWFTPIINYPEVAILGVGRITKEAVVTPEGGIVAADILKVSLSFDHRLIDGATAQLAMNELKKLLSDPSYLLMS